MSTEQLRYLIIILLGFSFLVSLITTLLSSRNCNKNLPDSLSDIFDNKQLESSVLYSKTKANFGITSGSLSLIITLIFFYLKGFGMLDQFIVESNLYPWLEGVWYIAILYFASDILGIPMDLYNQFTIEENFGFNTMTPKVYVMDKLKSYLLSAIIGGLILGTLFWMFEILNTDFWWYFWIVATAFMLFMNLFYTTLIVPIFNKLNPLEEGELKSAIVDYCRKNDFPLENVFVLDASTRSTKANAYFSGFGKTKKIVLYDTLIEQLSTEEIVAVLAHEAGHYKKKHIVQGLVMSILQTGAILYLSSLFLFNEQLSVAFGAERLSLAVNLVAFGILFSPISMFLGILSSYISRKNEYEADDFANKTYGAEHLISGLKKLSQTNLSNLTPHPLDVFLNYSHPTLAQRINALNKQL